MRWTYCWVATRVRACVCVHRIQPVCEDDVVVNCLYLYISHEWMWIEMNCVLSRQTPTSKGGVGWVSISSLQLSFVPRRSLDLHQHSCTLIYTRMHIYMRAYIVYRILISPLPVLSSTASTRGSCTSRWAPSPSINTTVRRTTVLSTAARTTMSSSKVRTCACVWVYTWVWEASCRSKEKERESACIGCMGLLIGLQWLCYLRSFTLHIFICVVLNWPL